MNDWTSVCPGGDGGAHGKGQLRRRGIPQQLPAGHRRAEEGRAHQGREEIFIIVSRSNYRGVHRAEIDIVKKIDRQDV